MWGFSAVWVIPDGCEQGVSMSFPRLFLMVFSLQFPLRELLVKDLDTPCRCCAADGIASADHRGLTFYLVSTGTIDPQGIWCRSVQVLS